MESKFEKGQAVKVIESHPHCGGFLGRVIWMEHESNLYSGERMTCYRIRFESGPYAGRDDAFEQSWLEPYVNNI